MVVVWGMFETVEYHTSQHIVPRAEWGRLTCWERVELTGNNKQLTVGVMASVSVIFDGCTVVLSIGPK